MLGASDSCSADSSRWAWEVPKGAQGGAGLSWAATQKLAGRLGTPRQLLASSQRSVGSLTPAASPLPPPFCSLSEYLKSQDSLDFELELELDELQQQV